MDPKITVADYGQRWLDQVEALVHAGERKPRTLETYDDVLRLHVEPRLGAIAVRDLGRADVKDFLIAKLRAEFDASTVSIIYRTLRALLSSAVDDEVISANPIAKLGRALGVSPSKADRQQAVRTKAMTRAQLVTFLATAAARESRWYPPLLTLARTGMRLGEALALQIGLHDDGDLDFVAREVTVARALSDDGHRVDTPKTGKTRVVDMSRQLTDTLLGHVIERRAEALRAGATADQRLWLFAERTGGPLDSHNIRRAFARVLKRAKLPVHFTPHCLRHTFASILIAEGKSPAYVQAQLGHASITMTVDTYGKWLPKGDKAAIDSLDDAESLVDVNFRATCTIGTVESGDRAYAVGTPGHQGGDQVVTFRGPLVQAPPRPSLPADVVPSDFRGVEGNGPCWTRTSDPLLKRQLL